MQEFYVSTVRFCALILEIRDRIYVTEFPYRITDQDASTFVTVYIAELVFQPVKWTDPTMNAPQESSKHQGKSFVAFINYFARTKYPRYG